MSQHNTCTICGIKVKVSHHYKGALILIDQKTHRAHHNQTLGSQCHELLFFQGLRISKWKIKAYEFNKPEKVSFT